MAKRPNIFDQEYFKESLISVGCPDSFINTTVSNFRLFIPIILSKLGEEKMLEILKESQSENLLGNQETAWRESCKFLVAWANKELQIYISQKK